DIFSLGVVLYEMTTGHRPFSGTTAGATTDQIIHLQPEPVTQSNHSVPVALRQIVRKCLAKDRAQRYQSARELVADLRQLQQEREEELMGAHKRSLGRAVKVFIRRQSVPRLVALALAITLVATTTAWSLYRHRGNQRWAADTVPRVA